MLVALLIVFIYARLAHDETAYSIVKNKVLLKSSWLDGAQVISQSVGSPINIDQQIDLHVRVSKEAIKDMTSGNAIKDCLFMPTHCTTPSWMSFRKMHELYPLMLPYIANADEVLCTSFWAVLNSDGSTNNQDMICVNTQSGDLYYTYYDV